MNDHEEPRHRRVQSIPIPEGMARERDPASLAQISARRAIVQAQAMLLRAQAAGLETAGAAG
jgi:hypothetical protein